MRARPAFLKTIGLGIVAATAVAIWSRYVAPYRPRLEAIEIPVPAGHESLAGLRIGFLTDTHAGPFVSPIDLRRAVAMLRQEAPDLVLLGGDYISESPRYADDAAVALGDLATVAPLGCLAVLGNHDLSTDRDRVTAALENHGIRVLRNQSALIETGRGPLWIAGVDETILGQADVEATFAGIPDGSAVLALWHEPDYAAQAAAAGAFAQLSGHTHGGQIRLPGIGPLVLPPGGKLYPAGTYVVNGLHLYTSRGLGVYRPPVRFLCPPEVTIVTLTTGR